jgi:hypothetical protein
VAAHWCWGVVGTAVAVQQQGFCRAMLLGGQRWPVGRAVALSRHRCRCAGVKREGPDIQLEGRGEGGGRRLMRSMMSSMTRGAWCFEGTWRCIGWCCWGVDGRAWDAALAGSSIQGDAEVCQAVLLGERRLCNGRDMVEAVGERSWCNRPCGGCWPQHFGTTWQCDGRCCQGRGSSATDNGVGCRGVLLFYMHMGMGEIDWREERDPIINKIKEGDIFYVCKR